MSDIGHYSLLLAFVVGVLGIGAAVYAGLRRDAVWTRVAERAVIITFGLTSVAMLALFHALAVNDFQLAFVAGHSARSMGLGYRLAALWGGQEGSLLLWCWMLLVYSVGVVWTSRNRNRTLIPWVLASLLLNALFFLVLTNFVTPPFEKLPPTQVLSDGTGLNPLLQHPVMLIHPLLLYSGFTGFAVPFSFALAALITGDLGTTWFRTTRRWTLFAWAILGTGLMLGGVWAYEVLGWGGYWAWDPVENASLMPWLAATAYVHSVMIQEKRDMLRIWNLILVGLAYSLCLFGTFLTRSGIVQSVHAFTNSGLFTYIFLGYVLFTLLSFYAALFYRRKELRSPNQLESVVSRESSFVLNNWVFMALLFVVFFGTLWPVITESLAGSRLTLGPGFFNLLAGPLSLLLLLLTGVAPLVAWRRATIANVRNQFLWPAVAGVVTGLVLGVVFWGQVGYWTLSCWTLSAFVLGTISQEFYRAVGARVRRRGESVPRAFATLMTKNQRRYGGYVVHVAFVLILLGISGAVFNQEMLENIRPGDSVEIHDYRLRYLTAEPIPAQHYGGAKARLALYRGDTPLRVMTPEKRQYWLEEQPVSIPSIHSTMMEDLYVILTAVEADGSATIKIYRNPLVNWIWFGLAIFILGSIIVMWPTPDRREGRVAA